MGVIQWRARGHVSTFDNSTILYFGNSLLLGLAIEPTAETAVTTGEDEHRTVNIDPRTLNQEKKGNMCATGASACGGDRQDLQEEWRLLKGLF